jgi:plastocyanin
MRHIAMRTMAARHCGDAVPDAVFAPVATRLPRLVQRALRLRVPAALVRSTIKRCFATLGPPMKEEHMAKTHTIEITGFAFPDNTPVAQGDTVEWINKMGMDHTVTADEGEFDSGPFGEDETFSYQFDTAGAFAYHCNIHRRMKGKVTVT